MSYIGRVMTNFVLKFPTFRYHGNRGLSDVYFNNIIKLLDLQNPLFGAGFVAKTQLIQEIEQLYLLY